MLKHVVVACVRPCHVCSWDFRADLSNKVGAAFVTAGGMSAGEELVRAHVTMA